MELKGKIFDIKGEKKEIVNTDEDFAYFSDGARVKKEILVTKYEEVMDPTSFFNSESGLKNLANDFEKIDANAVTEQHVPTTNVNTQESVTTVVNNAPDNTQVIRVDSGLKPAESQGGDFFSKIKRNNTIDIDFTVSEKFPDLDFVRMMNDNYETSIVDHFAREIVEKMIYDPEALLESIKERINEIVYGKEHINIKEVEQNTPFSNELTAENDNDEVIEKITEDRKVVEVEEQVEEIANNVNEQQETNEENEQETNKETTDTGEQPELEQEA